MNLLLNQTIKKIIRPYRNLPAEVYILFFARIINRMGDFANFFLTLYLTRFLNFNEKQTGFVLSMVGVCMMGGALLGGKLTDIAGRKKLMLSIQSLGAVCMICCGFIPDSSLLPYLLLIFTFFNGAVRPINSALLTDLTTAEQRSSAFSLLYLGINIGVAAGPILAGFLFNHYRQWIFWGDGLTSIISILLILLFIQEPVQKRETLRAEERHVEGHSIQALLGIPVLAKYAVLTIFSSFIYSQHNFTLPLQLLENFKDNGAKIFGFIMSFNALAVLFLTPLFNHLTRNKNPLRRIAIGQIFYGIGFGILFIDIPFILLYFLSTLLWTAGEVLDAMNSGVFVANNSPVNHRGRFNSIFLVTKGAGRALAPFVSGFILNSFSISYMWLITFVMGISLFFRIRQLEGCTIKKR